MNSIKSFSPTRIDLAGGTLDLWPLFNFVNKTPVTLNVAIDIFTYAEIIEREDSKVLLKSEDMGFERLFDSFEECIEDHTPELKLLRCICREFPTKKGFELYTKSESPVGAGLGGSSSLCISIIKAFLSWQNLKLGVHEIVHLAHNIESRVLNTPTGTQDYYPPLESGILALEYSSRGIGLESLKLDIKEFNEKSIVVYTGKPHMSGLNNWEVVKKAVAKDKETLSALNDLNDISNSLLNSFREKGFSEIKEHFQREYEARNRLSEVFSSPQIKELHAMVEKEFSGALKICGAGGGGCVLLWLEKAQREAAVKRVEEMGFKALNNKAFLYG
ncbi:MAG: galactokinase [Bdellovibrionota bacterium]|nr:galactokinase [Bdellovibrionota bacterium]